MTINKESILLRLKEAKITISDKDLDEVIKQKEDASASSFFISPTIVCTTQRVFSHLRQSLPIIKQAL